MALALSKGALTMPAPQADPPRCDVFGCGRLAVHYTDGTEKDAHSAPGESGPRPAIPRLNICELHLNWPHSTDAARFAAEGTYLARKANPSP
jgi:hypothetical protein